MWGFKDGGQVGLTDKVAQTKDLHREAGSSENIGKECSGRRTQPWPLEVQPSGQTHTAAIPTRAEASVYKRSQRRSLWGRLGAGALLAAEGWAREVLSAGGGLCGERGP